ncbi:MAG TPA: Holliday junction branch migration protein RuvA [Bacteroidia bacterium]|jgi:Holliday junction DNA helicase RuvA|nr:Holliday junction branch migration protein RuvA [Bacteroidia bacterium]
MIDYIEGKLVEKTPTYVVVSCSGIGYVMQISLNTSSRLEPNAPCKLFTEQTYVRDDLPRFYGFHDKEERVLFRMLISVSGVGGNSAMLMLSSLSAEDIQRAIATADVNLLKSVKGIGEKTAQRIIVDLKGKLGKSDPASEKMVFSDNKTRNEALSALVMLGFVKASAEKAIDKVYRSEGNVVSVEHLIKQALKHL